MNPNLKFAPNYTPKDKKWNNSFSFCSSRKQKSWKWPRSLHVHEIPFNYFHDMYSLLKSLKKMLRKRLAAITLLLHFRTAQRNKCLGKLSAAQKCTSKTLVTFHICLAHHVECIIDLCMIERWSVDGEWTLMEAQKHVQVLSRWTCSNVWPSISAQMVAFCSTNNRELSCLSHSQVTPYTSTVTVTTVTQYGFLGEWGEA